MSRDLPQRPNIEHLKKQAKELLAAHKRGDPEALDRIRASLPACAALSPDAVADFPLALHDAQSALAREYGAHSWAELRARVRAASGQPPTAPVVQPARQAIDMTDNLPADLQALAAEVRAKLAAGPVYAPTPERIAALPLRNTMAAPGAVAMLMVGRPASLRAVEAALRNDPALICIAAQRKQEVEEPVREDLHDVACLGRLLATCPGESGTVQLAVEGIRWVTLMALETTSPYYVVRIADYELEPSEAGAERIAQLDRKLRERCRELAKVALPPEACEAALALIDTTQDPERLADIVLANLTTSSDERADYAQRTDLVERLERLLEFVEREFTLPVTAASSN
ncbi:MAG: LON peptidase substrate-binding domain-containing protein [Polyangiaceae bacterium]|nr:LON peptidase substrate-binding domain-containing protein [Polyangiaceae bacterium]